VGASLLAKGPSGSAEKASINPRCLNHWLNKSVTKLLNKKPPSRLNRAAVFSCLAPGIHSLYELPQAAIF
jgi:hypothetical protein